MLRYRSVLILLVVFVVLGGLVAVELTGAQRSATTGSVIPAYVTAAVAYPGRPQALNARDPDRKPAEVLAFSGIKPGDKVGILLPDRDYVSIIAKVVGYKGKVYGVEGFHGVPRRGTVNWMMATARKWKDEGKLFTPIVVYEELEMLQHTTVFRNFLFIFTNINAYGGSTNTPIFPIPEQLDAVFTADRYHEMHNTVDAPDGGNPAEDTRGPMDAVGINKAIFRTMKPGGIYVVTDYAAAKGAGFSQSQALNRVEADAVKQEVLAAGFEFVGESNVLANPSEDHSKPAVRDKSDRFILRFKKPANASPATKRLKISVMKNWFGNTRVVGSTKQDLDKMMQGVVMYHADTTMEEEMPSIGDQLEYEWLYWDADGNYCNYHEYPQDAFDPCYPMLDMWGDNPIRKVGDVWTGRGDSRSTLAKGVVWPKGKYQPTPTVTPLGLSPASH